MTFITMHNIVKIDILTKTDEIPDGTKYKVSSIRLETDDGECTDISIFGKLDMPEIIIKQSGTTDGD